MVCNHNFSRSRAFQKDHSYALLTIYKHGIRYCYRIRYVLFAECSSRLRLADGKYVSPRSWTNVFVLGHFSGGRVPVFYPSLDLSLPLVYLHCIHQKWIFQNSACFKDKPISTRPSNGIVFETIILQYNIQGYYPSAGASVTYV